jgi:hypothetical protein
VTKDFSIPKVDPNLINIKVREGKLTASFSTESLRKPFTYIFKDPKWMSKFLIYLGITLAAIFIPVLPVLIIMGFGYQIMHRIIVEEGEPVLPEWTDWGKLLGDGWRLFCVTFIYRIPMLIVQVIAISLYFGYLFSVMFLSENNNGSVIFGLSIIFMLFFFLAMVFSLLLSVLNSIILPPALCHTVEKDSFKAGFEIKKWWPVYRANFGGFLLALVILFGILTVFILFFELIYMSLVLWCLLPFILLFGSSYLGLVMYPLIALVYREGRDRLVGSLDKN